MIRTYRHIGGYILPATILLSVAIAIIAVILFQFIVSSSQALNSQSYKSIADEAARAGISYATSCAQAGTSDWTSPLTPGVTCALASSGTPYVAVSPDGAWRSTFSVDRPVAAAWYGPGAKQITSHGTVQLLSGGSPVGTPYTMTRMTLLSATSQVLPVSTGESATDIKADTHTCSINNGKLYCWGQNTYGELGVGDIVPRSSPTLVGGLLAGKYVSKVAIGDANTCAIADGEAYCWGDGSNGIIGNGSTSGSNVPVHVGGTLASRKVTDISVSSTSWPLPQVLPTMRHACALVDGAPYCWGGNEYLQLGNQVCVTIFFLKTCNIDNGFPPSTPLNILYSTPQPVFGYDMAYANNSNGSPIYGDKLDRVGAGGHFSCGITQGQMYCWGMRLPAAWGMPKPATFIAGPYTMPGANDGLNIDPNSFELTGDSACNMASWKFNCMGYTPAFSGIASFITAYFLNAPITLFSGFDVQSHDNGQLPVFFAGGLVGANYCAIANGQAGCVASVGGADGSGGFGGIFGSTNFKPVSQAGSPSLVGKTPTKIAAAGTYGSLIANGQLFSWGSTAIGQLGNGSLAATVPYPSQIAAGTLGTNPGTYAASGPVATGGGQSCAVVNGGLYCWGKNDKGQLGMGYAGTDVNQPTAVPSAVGMIFTKVSAGTNHTCGISNGQLYCWGDNTYGQLGLGTTGGSPAVIPTAVIGLGGKRITDVSAGDSGTCAIADGTAYCWGKNTNAQVGDGTTTTRNVPVQVSALSTLATTSISIGTNHACAVASGNGYCWGSNANYATGLNVNTGNTATATLLTAGAAGGTSSEGLTPAFTSISAGNNFTCAIVNSFTSCWGKNDKGQAGVNTTTDVKIPTKVTGTGGTLQATSIATGDSHACGTLQGKIYCWGAAANGRLGDGQASTNRLQPVLVNGGSAAGNAAIAISAGTSSSCAIANGKVLCWGDISNGRTGLVGVPSDLLQPAGTSDYVITQPFKPGPIY